MITSPEGRRMGRLPITAGLLVNTVRDGFPEARVVANPLPEDAEIVGARFELPGTIVFMVASESYPVVPWESPLPELPSPQFQTVSRPSLEPSVN